MIQSVKKAADILWLLSEDPEHARTLGSIAGQLGMNKSTCAHILDTLCDALCVERISRKDGYRLGAGTYMLTRYGRYQESLIEVCSPVIRWLNKHLDATVLLSVVCDGQKFIIYHVDSSEKLSYSPAEIIRGKISSTATGLLLMAYMSPESLIRTFYRIRSDGSRTVALNVSDVESIESKLDIIRRDGYAYVHAEAEKRQTFAFRVCNHNTTVAAIGVMYHDSKDSEAMRTQVISAGKYAADEITRRLKLDSG